MAYSDIVPLLLTHYKIEFDHDGTDAQFLCPFHAEDTPSCRMSFETGLWYCFGCGEKGNISQFVCRLEGDDLLGMMLIRRLERNHPVAEEARARIVKAREEREIVDPVLRFSHYRKIDWAMIPKTHAVYDYFVRRRGISSYTLTGFDARLTGDDDYPLAIPIMRDGEMMGYVKRYVGDLNCCETCGDVHRGTATDLRLILRDKMALLDHKFVRMRRYLYNKGMSAKEAMAYHNLGNGPLLIVEGMLDYIKAAQFGARAATAILSWQIKPPQVEFLKRRGIEEVVCALDDDEVGRKGCALLTEYFRVRRFRYPGPPAKDIADLNQNEFWYGYEAAEVFENATASRA